MHSSNAGKTGSDTKFIVVAGGVLSGVGKGIVASSIGLLLKARGFSVTAVKIDPYLNVDAGTMRPSEHGEVWVTDDGGEIDQDLGNYERFLGFPTGKENNMTTGRVFLSVIEKERRGEYLGKTVQLIPHVVDEVIERIERVSKGFDFCIIEVGGTTGDLENAVYLEAVRRMKWVRQRQVAFALVAYLPVLGTVGEQKTKPLQHAVSQLRATGIMPDFLFTRSKVALDDVRKEKLVQQCGVFKQNIIDSPDLDSVYKVPLKFEEQGLGGALLKFFHLPPKDGDLSEWNSFVESLSSKERVKIALVGKYFEDGSTSSHEDVYLSVKEALVHAAAANNVSLDLVPVSSHDFSPEKLKGFHGVLVPGGFGSKGVEGKISAARHCRENNLPYLGICYGMQLAVVEFARNVLGLEGAHTTEVDPQTPHAVIDILPEQKAVERKGGTMRLGSYDAVLKEGTKVHALYEELGRLSGVVASERHRHRYEVNPSHVQKFEESGLVFSGFHERKSDAARLAEFVELSQHPFFVGTQAHPEFKSRPNNPSPLYYGFVRAAKEFASR